MERAAGWHPFTLWFYAMSVWFYATDQVRRVELHRHRACWLHLTEHVDEVRGRCGDRSAIELMHLRTRLCARTEYRACLALRRPLMSAAAVAAAAATTATAAAAAIAVAAAFHHCRHHLTAARAITSLPPFHHSPPLARCLQHHRRQHRR